jgi:hypothetical protein
MNAQADTRQQQQQHAENNDNVNIKNDNKAKSRWSNWVEEQNRRNEIRASKPDNILTLKFAGIAGIIFHTGIAFQAD